MVKVSPSEAAALSLKVIRYIESAMETGDVPSTVKDFTELQNHVDANEYILEALGELYMEFDASSEEQAALTDRAIRNVNVWLAAKR